MNIVLINGNPDAANCGFDRHLHELRSFLDAHGNETTVLTLRDMQIRQCCGCFHCWVKHPGTCGMDDDARTVIETVINADFFLFATPLTMGFISPLLKRTMDRFIPLLMPYFELVNGEVHHEKRYDTYPTFGVLLQKEADTDDEDLRILGTIYERMALNLRTECLFIRSTEQPAEETAYEIGSR